MDLLQLTYISRATERFSARDLPELISHASRRNAALGITGALYFAGGRFVQVLEGEESCVRSLYASIVDDPRHTEVETVAARVIERRRFPTWAMGELSPVVAANAAKEAFRIAHTATAGWTEGALNEILDAFETALDQASA